MARDEIAKIRAQQVVAAVVTNNTPPSAKYKLQPGDRLLVFRETQPEWIHGFRIVDLDGKLVRVIDGQRVIKLNKALILPEIVNSEEKYIIKLLRSMCQFSTGGLPGIFNTKILAPKDIRRWTSEFINAKKEKVTGMIKKDAFEIVIKDDVPENANILCGRLVLALMNDGTNK